MDELLHSLIPNPDGRPGFDLWINEQTQRQQTLNEIIKISQIYGEFKNEFTNTRIEFVHKTYNQITELSHSMSRKWTITFSGKDPETKESGNVEYTLECSIDDIMKYFKDNINQTIKKEPGVFGGIIIIK